MKTSYAIVNFVTKPNKNINTDGKKRWSFHSQLFFKAFIKKVSLAVESLVFLSFSAIILALDVLNSVKRNEEHYSKYIITKYDCWDCFLY